MALSGDRIIEGLITPLKAFEYQYAGEIIFGNGRISEIGSVVSRSRHQAWWGSLLVRR